MSRARRLRRQQKLAAAAAKAAPQKPWIALPPQPPVSHAPLWLSAAFLIPNLGALACKFVFDDRVLVVQNESLHVHSLRQLAHIWKSGYWPDPHGIELYRPVSQTLWALTWAAGGGSHPALFHGIGLLVGVAVVLLLYHFFLAVEVPPRTAFIAALLFALFPIHTDATTSVVGSAELLAAAFSLGALLFYYRRQPIPALILFALAVLSKESAAAFAALPVVFPRKDWRSRDSKIVATGAGVIIVAALLAHRVLSRSSLIPPIDNPMALIDAGQRVLTALWIQCLYLFKTLLPITLSADYSYKQIRLVMGPEDWRAWMGLALAAGAIYLVVRWPESRPPVLAYAVLFSPTANILFPIGTIMGERLMYAPSLGLALLLAILLSRTRRWNIVLLAVALIFGARTAVRNLDWLNPERFYTRLAQTSPDSAKSHYSVGVMHAASGDDVGAIEAYDRAIAIFPAYAEAYRNRGNSLARLGRNAEAMDSYRSCLRFDPGDFAAAFNLGQLQAGIPINPPRAALM
jgi:tetratricopeptide (TPR) repeat protein